MMKITHLLAIALILVATSIGWVVLSAVVAYRSSSSGQKLCADVQSNWGSAMMQQHPRIYYASPTSGKTMREIQPESSAVKVDLLSDPKQKGLLWYRTYQVDFQASYEVVNPTPIRQTVYLEFALPAQGTSYDHFELRVGDKPSTNRTPHDGKITEAILMEPGHQIPVSIAYRSRGLDSWQYTFPSNRRIRNFTLAMTTNFVEIDFPARTSSPSSRQLTKTAGTFAWEYPDVIDAHAIGMGMPVVLNPGPTVERITRFAPISLLFFFTVLVLVGALFRSTLHPMNYFFLAAGFFSFQLLLAYLVDILPLLLSFVIACVVSLVLVCGYIFAVSGVRLTIVAAIAQVTYLILFSYSFFFEGLTGITITVGAILTLAILMMLTAKLDWQQVFARPARQKGATPPPVPNV